MQIIILGLFAVLIALTFLVVKFMQSDAKEKQSKESQISEMVADLEGKLKRVQDELGKEITEKEEIEKLLYKTKDELDTLKNQKGEFEKKAKDLDRFKEDAAKKDEALKQEVAAREKIQAEFVPLKKEKDETQQQRDLLQKEMAGLKSDAVKREELLKQLTQENAQLKAESEPMKKELEQLKSRPAAADSGKLNEEKNILQKENEELKKKLKLMEEMHEGLKGQYDELSAELEEINMKKIGAGSGQQPQPAGAEKAAPVSPAPKAEDKAQGLKPPSPAAPEKPSAQAPEKKDLSGKEKPGL